MRAIVGIIFFLFIFLMGCSDQLVKNKKSDFVIVTCDISNDVSLEASSVLQDYIYKMTKVKLIVDTIPGKRNIFIGLPENAPAPIDDFDISILEEDGFYLKTLDGDLYIIGGSEKGVLYGVYDLLEKLGCRQYTAEVQVVPELDEIILPELDEIQVPKIKYRDVLYHNTKYQEFAEWHKLDVPLHGDDRKDWGYWCHSSFELVDPDIYFDKHPEYFAFLNGKRIPSTQLCTTNPEVIQIVVNRLREEMQKKPDAQYWSVSQEDNYGYCHCDKCQEINEREGTPMGAILYMVNQVADSFPDKTISTLAYEYSRRPPKYMRPRKNVNVMLCSIECNRSMPIADDPSSVDFRTDVLGWDSICDNILVWDYVIQFKNLLSPFPNFHVIQPNLQFFAEHGGLAEFQQGNREVGGEFAELRAYLIAKLLWNPDADVDLLMRDFLNGYYGNAGEYIYEYIDKMTKALVDSGDRLDIFGNPIAAKKSYLSPELLSEYEILFDKAEDAVSDDSIILERVRICRLPLLYARLEQAKADPFGPDGWYRKQGNNWLISDALVQVLEAFVELANQQGVTRIHEWETTVDEYYEESMTFTEFDPEGDLAFQAFIKGTKPNVKYAHNGVSDLTNGIRGTGDWSVHWLGYEGVDLDFVISLPKTENIKEVEMGFVQDSGSWIFYPKMIRVYVSEDGEDFSLFAERLIPAKKKESKVGKFVLQGNANAKFIKVVIEASKQCPDWHVGHGNPSWTFVDEILVR